MKKIILSLLVLLVANSIHAQELTKEQKAAQKAAKKEAKAQLREAQKINEELNLKIQEKKADEATIIADSKKALDLLQKALKSNLLDDRETPEAYRLSAEFAGKPHNIQIALAQNKQPIDTTYFFDNLRMLTDALHNELLTTKVVKGETGNEAQLKAKRVNLEQCGTHYIYAAQFEAAAKQYDRALQAYTIAMEYPKVYSTVGPDFKLAIPNEQVAYYAYYTAYNAKKYDVMDKFYDEAIKFQQGAEGVKQVKIQSYLEKGDTVAWAGYLREITLKDPVNNADYIQMLLAYNQKAGKEQMLKYAGEVLAVDPNILIANYGMAHALFISEKYDEALKYYVKCSELKPDYYDAWYQSGLCKYRQALALNSTISGIKNQKEAKEALEKTKTLFGEAIPYFEKAKECAPNDPQKWAYELKQCYTVTGQSAKAAEMDKLL